RVVAVEDTSTTGGSVLTACEALTEAGADIAAVAVIGHRSDASREAVEAARHRYLAAYDVSALELSGSAPRGERSPGLRRAVSRRNRGREGPGDVTGRSYRRWPEPLRMGRGPRRGRSAPPTVRPPAGTDPSACCGPPA